MSEVVSIYSQGFGDFVGLSNIPSGFARISLVPATKIIEDFQPTPIFVTITENDNPLPSLQF